MLLAYPKILGGSNFMLPDTRSGSGDKGGRQVIGESPEVVNVERSIENLSFCAKHEMEALAITAPPISIHGSDRWHCPSHTSISHSAYFLLDSCGSRVRYTLSRL